MVGARPALNKDRFLAGALLGLVAAVAWGAQFPIASRILTVIDPFYFTVIRYVLVSLILVILLAMYEGVEAIRLDGRGTSVWFYGTMAFTGYNFLVFLGQKMAGQAGAVLAAIMMALMPMVFVLVLWILRRTKPSAVTLGCIAAAFVGVSLVITRGDITALSSTTGNLVPSLMILAGVFAYVVYTIGASTLPWSPLRYTTLTCILGTVTGLAIVVAATLAGQLAVPTIATLSAIHWEMGYMIIISGVLAQFCWNASNTALTPINGVLFVNLVPVATFVIEILTGYRMGVLEVVGIVITISALVANNLTQRQLPQVQRAR